jgi:hypothetical protein
METRELLSLLLGEGVKTFVCLQEEYPADSVTELQWRSGQVLRPYYRDVLTLVGEGALSGTSTVCAGKQDATRFVHFPIVDCDVTDDDDVVDLAVHLCESLLRGEVIYMHCWGGHGRTGTLACIMLHMLYGLDAAAAMGRCQECHDLRHWPVDVTSPQTSAQREQVERVIARLAQAQAGAAPTLTPTFAPLEAPALARAQATGADCASSKSDNTANELSEDDPSLTGAKRWSKALLEEDLGSDSPAAVAAYAFSRSHSRSSYDVLSEAGSGSGSEADEEPTAAPLSPGVIKRRKVDED